MGSKIPPKCPFNFDPEDGGSMYLRMTATYGAKAQDQTQHQNLRKLYSGLWNCVI
jgi:hypothetical protein